MRQRTWIKIPTQRSLPPPGQESNRARADADGQGEKNEFAHKHTLVPAEGVPLPLYVPPGRFFFSQKAVRRTAAPLASVERWLIEFMPKPLRDNPEIIYHSGGDTRVCPCAAEVPHLAFRRWLMSKAVMKCSGRDYLRKSLPIQMCDKTLR